MVVVLKKVRAVQVVAILLVVLTFFFYGCFNDKWYKEYPIAYGEGVVWMCDNEDISFKSSFETASIQYGHYGQGDFTYQDSTEDFQLMFTQNRVDFVFLMALHFKLSLVEWQSLAKLV